MQGVRGGGQSPQASNTHGSLAQIAQLVQYLGRLLLWRQMTCKGLLSRRSPNSCWTRFAFYKVVAAVNSFKRVQKQAQQAQ